MVKAARLTGRVVGAQGFHEGALIQVQTSRQLGQAGSFHSTENRWHKASYRLGINDGIGELPRLLRHQAPPDGIALGPEVFTLIVKTLCFAVNHHTQGNTVDSGAYAAVIQGCTGINGNHVRLGGVTNGIGALDQQMAQQCALVVARATHQKVVCRPLTTLVLSPSLAQPISVGLKTATGEHAGASGNAFTLAIRGDKLTLLHFNAVHRSLIPHLYAQPFRAAVIGIHQGFAAAHKESIGACRVQRARQGRLEVHAVATHPGPAGSGLTNHQARQGLVGLATGDFEQVLPELFFRIGLYQHILGGVMHAAQIAGVGRVAPSPFARRSFEHQHASPSLARHQCRAQSRIASTNDQYVPHRIFRYEKCA